jgi:pyocin large subunit-like protein
MEPRKKHDPSSGASSSKFSDLPVDYVKMVNEVFTTNYDEGLKALAKINPARAYFSTTGRIYIDEIIVCVSLLHEGQMAATSVYASSDYDPKASSPTIQDLLAACVDSIGAVYSQLLSPETPEVLEQLANESLSALENIPYDWTEFAVEKRKVYLKVDKANPEIDQMTEEFLKKHDPDFQAEIEEEQKETEKLFVTGPKRGSTTH